MIDVKKAREIAQEYLDRTNSRSRQVDKAVILDEVTEEHDFGWVFFYQSERFIATNDPMAQLYGNAPMIIRKSDGKLFLTGTARRTEYYVENFKKYGTPNPPA